MNSVRIKICGITNIDNALEATAAGADAIGLVFYQPSPRSVSIEQAVEIVQTLPPFVSSVGLFVNAEAEYINKVLEQVPLDLLQFHGDETEEQCTKFNRPYIKAIRIKPEINLIEACQTYKLARGILVDTYNPKVAGGTGEVFDWTLLPNIETLPKKIILAGGLTSNNVANAVQKIQPWAVDVSGGVEKSKGIKDNKLMINFVNQAKGKLL